MPSNKKSQNLKIYKFNKKYKRIRISKWFGVDLLKNRLLCVVFMCFYLGHRAIAYDKANIIFGSGDFTSSTLLGMQQGPSDFQFGKRCWHWGVVCPGVSGALFQNIWNKPNQTWFTHQPHYTPSKFRFPQHLVSCTIIKNTSTVTSSSNSTSRCPRKSTKT